MEANTIQGNIAVSGAGLCLLSPLRGPGAEQPHRGQSGLGLQRLRSGGQGGGMLCDFNVNATGPTIIANNTIVGNNAPPNFLGHFGGGIAMTLYTNGLILANNIIASNSSGIWRYPYLSYQPVLQNNCLNNSNANYVNLTAGAGDIQADPQFVNRAAGDFHLLSDSPCIDAGTSANAPASDFDGVARPLDGNANGVAAFDMGAFEFVHPLADTDGDSARDAAEVIAGTNPTDPASVLRLNLQLLSLGKHVLHSAGLPCWGGPTLRVRSGTGPAGDWQTAVSNLAGSGLLKEWQEPVTGNTARFYRLRVIKD